MLEWVHEIIRGCYNRDKGTAEDERLSDPKFIFSYPKNERLILLNGRNAAWEEISTMRVRWQSADRCKTYPLFVLGETAQSRIFEDLALLQLKVRAISRNTPSSS